MIKVDRGGEYAGETYIWCDAHSPGHPVTAGEREAGLFEGDSLADLLAFIAEHREHDGRTVG